MRQDEKARATSDPAIRIQVSTRQIGPSVHQLGDRPFWVKLAFGGDTMSQTAYATRAQARDGVVSVALVASEGLYRAQVHTETEPEQQFDLVIAVTAPLRVEIDDSVVGEGITLSPALGAMVTPDRALKADPL